MFIDHCIFNNKFCCFHFIYIKNSHSASQHYFVLKYCAVLLIHMLSIEPIHYTVIYCVMFDAEWYTNSNLRAIH